jgi:hypothetical protein
MGQEGTPKLWPHWIGMEILGADQTVVVWAVEE